MEAEKMMMHYGWANGDARMMLIAAFFRGAERFLLFPDVKVFELMHATICISVCRSHQAVDISEMYV